MLSNGTACIAETIRGIDGPEIPLQGGKHLPNLRALIRTLAPRSDPTMSINPTRTDGLAAALTGPCVDDDAARAMRTRMLDTLLSDSDDCQQRPELVMTTPSSRVYNTMDVDMDDASSRKCIPISGCKRTSEARIAVRLTPAKAFKRRSIEVRMPQFDATQRRAKIIIIRDKSSSEDKMRLKIQIEAASGNGTTDVIVEPPVELLAQRLFDQESHASKYPATMLQHFKGIDAWAVAIDVTGGTVRLPDFVACKVGAFLSNALRIQVLLAGARMARHNAAEIARHNAEESTDEDPPQAGPSYNYLDGCKVWPLAIESVHLVSRPHDTSKNQREQRRTNHTVIRTLLHAAAGDCLCGLHAVSDDCTAGPPHAVQIDLECCGLAMRKEESTGDPVCPNHGTMSECCQDAMMCGNGMMAKVTCSHFTSKEDRSDTEIRTRLRLDLTPNERTALMPIFGICHIFAYNIRKLRKATTQVVEEKGARLLNDLKRNLKLWTDQASTQTASAHSSDDIPDFQTLVASGVYASLDERCAKMLGAHNLRSIELKQNGRRLSTKDLPPWERTPASPRTGGLGLLQISTTTGTSKRFSGNGNIDDMVLLRDYARLAPLDERDAAGR